MKKRRMMFAVSAIVAFVIQCSVVLALNTANQSFNVQSNTVRMFESISLVEGISWWDNVQGKAYFLTSGYATDVSFPTVKVYKTTSPDSPYETKIFTTSIRSFNHDNIHFMVYNASISIDLNGQLKVLSDSY